MENEKEEEGGNPLVITREDSSSRQAKQTALWFSQDQFADIDGVLW